MKKSKEIALCGILAALAAVIMCFGGMIPFMTYVCPVVCIVIASLVLNICGNRSAWCWYAAVCILALLLCPDKEAAAIFAVFGYYPMVRRILEKIPLKWLIKAVYFNAVILLLYWILLNLFGISQLIEEFATIGTVLAAIMLIIGNLVFFVIDRILSYLDRKFV